MEIVYILTNPAFPDYIKIGRTTNLKQRLLSLDTTSLPLPFECYYAVKVDDSKKVEKLLHQSFDKYRVRSNREFFEILPENAKSALQLANGKEVTPNHDIVESSEDQRALNNARSKRERFKFSLLNIPPGTILTFAKDNEITCEVIDDRLVKFRDKEMTLTASALIIIHELGYDWSKISGPAFWQYNGVSLYDMRLKADV
tara:strand:+ start:151 stop:750 length:600 start_codon:yes stop_codon:yes gene_type:complete